MLILSVIYCLRLPLISEDEKQNSNLIIFTFFSLGICTEYRYQNSAINLFSA